MGFHILLKSWMLRWIVRVTVLITFIFRIAPLHNQHNAATTPLLAAVNKTSSHGGSGAGSLANRAVNKLTGNSSSSSARAAIDGGHSPSPDFTGRYITWFFFLSLSLTHTFEYSFYFDSTIYALLSSLYFNILTITNS